MRDREIVIVIRDIKGRCIFVGEQKVVDSSKKMALSNETFIESQKRESRILELERRVATLELELKLDRGEISKEDYESEVAKL